MKLQRTTLILFLLALGLGTFVYFYDLQGVQQQSSVASKERRIFSFEEEQVQSLKVNTNGQRLEFERAGNGTTWLMKTPHKAPATEAAVLYLMDLLVKGKSSRTLQVPANQLQEYGLERPQTTMEIKLNNQQTHQFILGKPDFNRSFLYAQADPVKSVGNTVEVLLVSTDMQNAVNRPLSEWISQDTPRPEKADTRQSPSPQHE